MEKEYAAMVNDYIYQQYEMERNHIHDIFKKTSMTEYIALKQIERQSKENSEEGKTYLKDLSKSMNMNMRLVSDIAGRLKDTGYILWKHDGDGENGTYILITEAGIRFLEEQDEKIDAYFEKVIKKYGMRRMGEFLAMFKDLQRVMNEELMEEENGSESN